MIKKARKAQLIPDPKKFVHKLSKTEMAEQLFLTVKGIQALGWCAEELLAGEIKKQERALRRLEQARLPKIRR